MGHMGFPWWLSGANPPASVYRREREGHKIWKNDKTQGHNIRIKCVEDGRLYNFD